MDFAGKFRKLLALFLSVCAIWAFSLSPLFRVTEIVTRGKYFTSAEYLDEALKSYYNRNVFLLSTGKIKDRLESHPWIESVKIRRKVPHTLEIYLEETYPVAALATGEGFILLNEEGMAIDRSHSFAKFEVPPITTPAPLPIVLGEKVNLQGLSKTLEILESIRYSGLPIELSEANLAPTGELTFYCFSGLKIIWGQTVLNDDKLQILQVLLREEADLSGVSLINLSDINGPAVKYRP